MGLSASKQENQEKIVNNMITEKNKLEEKKKNNNSTNLFIKKLNYMNNDNDGNHILIYAYQKTKHAWRII